MGEELFKEFKGCLNKPERLHRLSDIGPSIEKSGSIFN
jgi:hypothetical protein